MEKNERNIKIVPAFKKIKIHRNKTRSQGLIMRSTGSPEQPSCSEKEHSIKNKHRIEAQVVSKVSGRTKA
jgi:hypothetical protein